ncbi:hypothetical protein MCO_00976 [Bartonella sp. DB5-6]|uniref:hypothetical protein n=1 Tax=Bartonella sp. DB5-6 TaxID=1094755 RepID=UPI00026E9E65|nr:hypothetical protein [Bartonella sp. DB5-6]EJF79410.1 hypothetical protein MCO_00976 [Bartonella sp. DB5-6]
MRDIVIVIVGILILWAIVSDMWEEAENGRNTEFQGTLLLVVVLGVLWYLEFSRNFLLLVAILLFAWRNYLGIIANFEHDRLIENYQITSDWKDQRINELQAVEEGIVNEELSKIIIKALATTETDHDNGKTE